MDITSELLISRCLFGTKIVMGIDIYIRYRGISIQ